MKIPAKPIDLHYQGIRIRNLEEKEVPRVAAAIFDPFGFYATNYGVNTQDKVTTCLLKNLENHNAGLCIPLTFEFEGEVVGTTRLFRFEHARKSLEIGGTWIAPKWKRTQINTATKYILMKYAFEIIGAERIEFVVHEHNFISQMAVLRLGTKFEGRLRHTHPNAHPNASDSFIYSVTLPDWTLVSARLLKLQERQPVSQSPFSSVITNQNIRLTPYSLGDAEDFFDFLKRNQSHFSRSFPRFAATNSIQDTRALIADFAHKTSDQTNSFWIIRCRDTNSFVGHIAIKRIDWDLKSAEFGYAIDFEMQRRGYASLALKVLLEELVEKHSFKRLFVRILPENLPSQKLAKKMGFELEGIIRSAFKTGDGDISDILQMSYTR